MHVDCKVNFCIYDIAVREFLMLRPHSDTGNDFSFPNSLICSLHSQLNGLGTKFELGIAGLNFQPRYQNGAYETGADAYIPQSGWRLAPTVSLIIAKVAKCQK